MIPEMSIYATFPSSRYLLPTCQAKASICSSYLVPLSCFYPRYGVAYNPSAFVYRPGNCHNYPDGGITASKTKNIMWYIHGLRDKLHMINFTYCDANYTTSVLHVWYLYPIFCYFPLPFPWGQSSSESCAGARLTRIRQSFMSDGQRCLQCFKKSCAVTSRYRHRELELHLSSMTPFCL